MAIFKSKYTLEVVDTYGTLLADLGGRALKRRVVMSRNQPEQITWSLNLNEYEKYCFDNKLDPFAILQEGYSEVRVKRLGTYLCGGQILYLQTSLNSNQETIDITGYGFLKLFEKRYTGTTPSGTVNETYTVANGNSLSRQDLAWALISQSQSLTNGNFNISRGKTLGSTAPYDKTYSRTNIKNALQDMNNLQVAPIDMEFTYNKVFNCYAAIGSTRPDIVFEYPGNIIEITAPRDATNLANEAIATGQGSGVSQTIITKDDLVSQKARYLRQEVFPASGIDDSDGGITNTANTNLAAYSNPLRVPTFTVDGNKAPYITDYHIGDIVTCRVRGHSTLSYINGLYRIESITLTLDEDDNETIDIAVSAT